MQDAWMMFPVTMGDDQAFISFNRSFAERAASDDRKNYVRIEVAIKDPTEAGMPQGEEFKALAKLDDAFDAAFSQLDGVYVGRITVAGRRFFYFYLNASESEARTAAVQAAKPLGYASQISWALDPAKARYWQDLYPTADDWQVIKDMQVLDALEESGDNPDVSRTVAHWAYFKDERAASAFCDWLEASDFTCKEVRPDDDRICVRFTHEGVMHLADVTNRSIRCRRKAEELDGDYDGWETSVEKV